MGVFPDANSKSAQLFERGRQVMPGGGSRGTVFHPPYPIFARFGHGCRVTDVDGVQRLDFLNNYTTLIHGHAHPQINAAITEQLQMGASFAHPTEAEVKHAELLVSRVPSFDRVRFVNSGTEAVMNAIKAARAFTGRHKIAKCEGVYHGSYDFAEVSLDRSPANWGGDRPLAVPYARGTPPGVLEDVVVIPFNETEIAEQLLSAHGEQLAAVILDLMPNRAGLIAADPEFVEMVRRVTRANGAMLIVDEVITFRLGAGGAQGNYGLEPDLTTLGKIIGGGLPVGAVAGKAEVMEVFDHTHGKAPLPHGGTFNGNPLTMAAGHAAMELLTPEVLERINGLGARARAQLKEAFAVAGVPGDITGEGSLFAIHLAGKKLSTYRDAYKNPEEQELLRSVHHHLLREGIIVSPSGLGVLSTPMAEAEIDQLSEAFLGALRSLPQRAAVPA